MIVLDVFYPDYNTLCVIIGLTVRYLLHNTFIVLL